MTKPPVTSPPPTVIGPGATFRGDLSSSSSIEVRGTVEGDFSVDGAVVVHQGGRVFGNIDAVALLISGEVVAGILTADRIELRPTARVAARLRARVISIADGAFFDGTIEGRLDATANGTDRGSGPAHKAPPGGLSKP